MFSKTTFLNVECIRKAFKVTMIKKKLMLETQTLNYPPTHEKREETKRIYKVIRNDVLDVVETFEFFISGNISFDLNI